MNVVIIKKVQPNYHKISDIFPTLWNTSGQPQFNPCKAMWQTQFLLLPSGGDAQVVPVDPGQPSGEVRGVPVETARGPQLPPEALLDVVDWHAEFILEQLKYN